MSYTVEDIQKQFHSVADNIAGYIRQNKIKVGKNGVLSEKAYQILFDFCTADKINQMTQMGRNYINSYNEPAKHKIFFESQNERVSIFHDDAISFLKSMPSSSIDVIITDPAYSGMNQKLKLGSGKIIGKYSDAGKDGAKWFEEFHDTEENYKAFLKECCRVLKDNRHIYIMFDSYSLLSLAPVVREVFEVKNVICWDKANIGLGHYFRRRHEFILFASKGRRPLNSKNIPDVWKIKRVVSAKYPTQKPTEVFELMLKGSSEKDFVVCDPFLGSGSAAIAAIKSNCKFIGCDISEKALSFSMERVEQYLKNKTDIYQKSSLLGDDKAMVRIFINGKSQ